MTSESSYGVRDHTAQSSSRYGLLDMHTLQPAGRDEESGSEVVG